MKKPIKKGFDIGDMRLNKSGTIGTEPIMKKGKMYTNVKLGKLGGFDIPHHSGKGTRARLNAAAEKSFFRSKASK